MRANHLAGIRAATIDVSKSGDVVVGIRSVAEKREPVVGCLRKVFDFGGAGMCVFHTVSPELISDDVERVF